MDNQHYTGSCHCGDISFEFNAETIDKGLLCNCSLCYKKSAIMTAFTLPKAAINIHVKNNNLSTYEFGSQVAKHHFCKKCGIYTFHQTLRKPGEYRVHISCINEVDPLNMKLEEFDGASI